MKVDDPTSHLDHLYVLIVLSPVKLCTAGNFYILENPKPQEFLYGEPLNLMIKIRIASVDQNWKLGIEISFRMSLMSHYFIHHFVYCPSPHVETQPDFVYVDRKPVLEKTQVFSKTRVFARESENLGFRCLGPTILGPASGPQNQYPTFNIRHSISDI